MVHQTVNAIDLLMYLNYSLETNVHLVYVFLDCLKRLRLAAGWLVAILIYTNFPGYLCRGTVSSGN